MKKIIIASAVALSLASGAASPAFAAEKRQQTEQTQKSDSSASQSANHSASDTLASKNPIEVLIGLLLPAVQK